MALIVMGSTDGRSLLCSEVSRRKTVRQLLPRAPSFLCIAAQVLGIAQAHERMVRHSPLVIDSSTIHLLLLIEIYTTKPM